MSEGLTVLRFASSLDFSGELASGARAWEIAERTLAEASGQAVRTVLKPVWPASQLPGLIGRWLDEFEPDIVLIVISSFWVETETLTARFNRLGPVGERVAKASAGAAMRPVVASSFPYLFGRKVLMRTVGGRTNFTPAELESHVEAWLRAILRKESVGVAVVSTPFSPDTLATGRAQRRASARKDELRARLSALCEKLDVYCEMPGHAPDAFSPELRLADRVHFNEKAHARMGEIDGRALVTVWRSAKHD